jgi:hypothetical protein
MATGEKPYTLERTAGGRVPDLGQLISATIGDFTDNIGPYAMLGLGQFAVVFPVTLVAIVVIYFGIFAVMFGGLFGTGMLAAVIGRTSDDAAGLVMVLGELLSMTVMMAFIFGAIGLIAAIVAPISASTTRAIAAHQRGEAKLELSSAFSTATQDVAAVIAVTLLVTTVILGGMMFCYLPGLAAMILLSFAFEMVALHRRGALSAVSSAARSAMGNPSFYLMFGLVYFVIMMVAAYVPIIGPMFGSALHVRAYRELFGDGDEPVLASAA